MSLRPFSQLSAAERVAALLDRGSFLPEPDSAGAVLAGEGLLSGLRVLIAAFERRLQGGTIGAAEARTLERSFLSARQRRLPLLLAVDSAGARLDEGLQALGAFRAMFRAGLQARLAGVPMVALLGRNCFGGGSMVSFLCTRRYYSEATLLAMSGPAIIQALGGADQLAASDPDAVRALMGGAARCSLGAEDVLIPDSVGAYRQAAEAWLAHPAGGGTLAGRHRSLGERLGASGGEEGWTALPDRAARSLGRLFPGGYTARLCGGVLEGEAGFGEHDVALLGLVGGAPSGAREAWKLAGHLLETRSDRPLLMLADTAGHATRRYDESVILSAYIVHLCECAAAAAARRPAVGLVVGQLAGGVYVSFASTLRSLWALDCAEIRELPPQAIAQVLGRAEHVTITPEALLRAGVVDRILAADELRGCASDFFSPETMP